jgi:thiol-disulfide isomerase/thioredoxin
MKNRSIRVTTIVHTHCLGVYQRPVAPLRETLCDLSQRNAFDDFIMRSRVQLVQKTLFLSLFSFSAGKRALKEPTCCTRVTRLSRCNTRTRTHTNRQTDTHTHTHTHRNARTQKNKRQKRKHHAMTSPLFSQATALSGNNCATSFASTSVRKNSLRKTTALQTRCAFKGGPQEKQRRAKEQKTVVHNMMNTSITSNSTLKRGSLVKMNMGRIDAKNEWWLKDASPNMKDINGTPELLEALCDNQDKLVVVDVYAKWCGACRALYPKLCKMGRQFDGKMVLLKVNFDENKDMCKSLGVKVLPYMIMYKGNKGRVEEFSVSISKIKMLREKLDMHTTDIPGEDYSKDECNLEEFGDSVWGDVDVDNDAPKDAEGAQETLLPRD